MAFPLLEQVTVTIASGASLSGAANIAGRDVVGIVMPAAWTAAALTFQGSADGSAYNDVHDSGGTEVSYTVAASRYVHLGDGALRGMQGLKVRSGTSGTAVNQAAERSIVLLLRPIF